MIKLFTAFAKETEPEILSKTRIKTNAIPKGQLIKNVIFYVKKINKYLCLNVKLL